MTVCHPSYLYKTEKISITARWFNFFLREIEFLFSAQMYFFIGSEAKLSCLSNTAITAEWKSNVKTQNIIDKSFNRLQWVFYLSRAVLAGIYYTTKT